MPRGKHHPLVAFVDGTGGSGRGVDSIPLALSGVAVVGIRVAPEPAWGLELRGIIRVRNNVATKMEYRQRGGKRERERERKIEEEEEERVSPTLVLIGTHFSARTREGRKPRERDEGERKTRRRRRIDRRWNLKTWRQRSEGARASPSAAQLSPTFVVVVHRTHAERERGREDKRTLTLTHPYHAHTQTLRLTQGKSCGQ